MSATVIIIGLDTGPGTKVRRADHTTTTLQSSLPPSAQIQTQCPNCPGTTHPVFSATPTPTWQFVAAASAPNPTTEIYVITFATIASAESWISHPAQLDWLTAPGTQKYLVDNDAMP